MPGGAGRPPALLLFVLENISGCYAAMLIVHVHVHVKRECVGAGMLATVFCGVVAKKRAGRGVSKTAGTFLEILRERRKSQGQVETHKRM